MRKALGLYLVMLAGSSAAFAQSVIGVGGIAGIIRDNYGDGLPDVTVTVHNEALGVDRIVISTGDGIFQVPALPPGPDYTLKLTRKGFVAWESKPFEVLLGRNVDFRVGMQPSSSAAKVETAQMILQVADTKTDVSTLVTSQQVESLPTPARRVDPLVLLAPTANQDPTSGQAQFYAGAFPKTVFLDGADVTNHFYAAGNPLGIEPVPQDAIGSLQVAEAGSSAEFGKSMGATVSAVTKTGAQGVHGSAYGYLDNRNWNAPDRYAAGSPLNDSGHNLGADVGAGAGAFFLFANVESDRAAANGLNRITSPLLTASNCKATTVQCASATNFLNSQIDKVVPWSLTGLSGVVRMDLRPSEFNNYTLEGAAVHRYSPDGANIAAQSPNGGLLGYNGTYSDETRFGKFGWTRSVTDNTVNEARIGWFRDRLSLYSDPKLLPGTNPNTAVSVAGTQLGANPAFPSLLSEQRYQGVDNFTVTRGSHMLLLGGEFNRIEDFRYQLKNNFGAFTYPSLTAFALDFAANIAQTKNYSSFDQGLGNLDTDMHTMFMAGYAQDTWRALRKLTVTAGVRWEHLRFPQPSTPNTSFYQTASISSPRANFAPRFGLSYLLTRKTVVRAGVGMYYQQYPGELLDTLWGSNGYQVNISMNPNSTGAQVFPRRFLTTTNLPTGSADVAYGISKLRNPYTEQGDFSVERALIADITVTASYIETRGLKLFTASDLSLPSTTTPETYTIEDAGGNVVGTYPTYIYSPKANNAAGRQYQIDNEGQSKYRAAVVQVRKRFSHGIGAQASYTWSRATDDVSGAPVLGIIPSNVNPSDYVDDRGKSSFDQRQRAIVSWTWQPTVTKSQSAVARYLLNGWQFSGIATYATGLPQTPMVLVVGQQFANLKVTMAYPTSLNGTGGWSRVPFQAVNSLSLGNQRTVDARIGREIPFTERIRGHLSLEAFNALNGRFDTSMNTITYTATASILRPVPGGGSPNASWGAPFGTNARHFLISFRIVF